MRIRSRVLQEASQVATYQCPAFQLQGGQWVPWTIADKTSYETLPSIAEYSEDVSTPNFRKLSASGSIINSPYYHKKYTYYLPSGVSFKHKTTNYSGQGYYWDGMYVPFSDGFQLPPLLSLGEIPGWAAMKEDIIAKAVTAAYAAVDPAELLSLVSIAETGKTIDFMLSVLRKVLQAAILVRKLNWQAAKRLITPKQLAEEYMAIRYGLRPLHYDVLALRKALAKSGGHVRRTARGHASGVVSHEDTLTNCAFFYESVIDLHRTARYSASARAGVLYDGDIDTISVYGVDKIISSVWELVPLSFIIDWFCNVGATLAAWEPTSGCTQKASWVVIRQEVEFVNHSSGSGRSTAANPPWNNENYSTIVGGFEYGYKESALERLVEPALEVWPRMRIRLDTFKLTDLVIIIRQYLR